MITSPPRVRCTACAYEWRSVTLAADLRFVGHCPRCHGALDFLEPDAGPEPLPAEAVPSADAEIAPHLVLGVPRRDF